MAKYYKGLKDSVKDDLAKVDKPDDLADLIEQAVQIDNRLYERALERKGQYVIGHRKP
jgi:hypothetical protein